MSEQTPREVLAEEWAARLQCADVGVDFPWLTEDGYDVWHEQPVAAQEHYRNLLRVALSAGLQTPPLAAVSAAAPASIAAGRARAALAARPAPVVSRAEWQRIVDRVASQRFTDDDGNDAGTMHSGHAVMAVTLTLAALGITVADAPEAGGSRG